MVFLFGLVWFFFLQRAFFLWVCFSWTSEYQSTWYRDVSCGLNFLLVQVFLPLATTQMPLSISKKGTESWILQCCFVHLLCYYYFNCIFKVTVSESIWWTPVKLRSWDLTYFHSPPHTFQVVCNYCFSSPTKELAHQFGTFTMSRKATRTGKRGKFLCTKEIACICEGLLEREMCWRTGREKNEHERRKSSAWLGRRKSYFRCILFSFSL